MCVLLQDHSSQWLSLDWTRGKDLPIDELVSASTVVINGVVYCGGNNPYSRDVIQFTPANGAWNKLPKPPVCGFAMTSLNGQLVLAGGQAGDDRFRVWEGSRRDWVYPYPPMPTGRCLPAAVGYQKHLIVACGTPNRSDVEVLDSSSGRWYSAQPVPVGGQRMSSVLIGEHWYLSSYLEWKDEKEHIFCAHLPTLISKAMSARSTTKRIWRELPRPPVAESTLLGLNGQLLLVGGEGYVKEIRCYEEEYSEWSVCGHLPVGMCAPCCTVLPSGDLMVTRGMTGNTMNVSRQMWLASL